MGIAAGKTATWIAKRIDRAFAYTRNANLPVMKLTESILFSGAFANAFIEKQGYRAVWACKEDHRIMSMNGD